jgi:hypothetical protein
VLRGRRILNENLRNQFACPQQWAWWVMSFLGLLEKDCSPSFRKKTVHHPSEKRLFAILQKKDCSPSFRKRQKDFP